jgi:hypothetical protein
MLLRGIIGSTKNHLHRILNMFLRSILAANAKFNEAMAYLIGFCITIISSQLLQIADQ